MSLDQILQEGLLSITKPAKVIRRCLVVNNEHTARIIQPILDPSRVEWTVKSWYGTFHGCRFDEIIVCVSHDGLRSRRQEEQFREFMSILTQRTQMYGGRIVEAY